MSHTPQILIQSTNRMFSTSGVTLDLSLRAASLTRVRLITNPTFRPLWHERLGRVVPNAFDDPQPLRPPFSEKKTVTRGQVLRPLHKLEGNRGAVPCPDKGPVDIDDSASLGNRADVQHGLVLGSDGRCVRQNEDCFMVSGRNIVAEPGSGAVRKYTPSATNSRYTFGGAPSNLGNTTIPFRTSFLRTLRSANEADWPADAAGTPIRFLSMERIEVCVNRPSESGPI